MDPSIPAALFILLFAATHIGLAAPRVRTPLVARLGHWGFIGAFTAVAAVTFSLSIWWYATHQFEGAAGPALGSIVPLRWVLVGLVVVGIVLMAGSLADYADSPYALDGQEVNQPRGLARITRHAFFVGTVLFGGAHALLSTHLVGAVMMGGLALTAAVGLRFQDRKLLALRGAPYAEYLAASSTLPFAAILAGRQRFVWRELPFGGLLIGLGVAWALREVHASIFGLGGAYVIGAVLGGVAVILISDRLRGRKAAAVSTTRAAT